MASEDVIELGSSDDEAEPAIKRRKPTPNAMVHIPRNLHDVTIKPAKLNISSAIPKELAGKNVTVTKIRGVSNILANPYAMKSKPNGKPMQIRPVLPKPILNKQVMQNLILSHPQVSKKPITIQNKTVNPMSIMKKINSQVVINKVPTTPKVLKNPIKIQSPRTINNLPPSITITRTAGGQKRAAPVNVANTVRKKQKRNTPKTTVGEVLTVDLDDDEVSSSSTASPQWYLRPEEQVTPTLEEENNKEPEPCKSPAKLAKASKEMIEITIEDSPVKPIKDKRTCEVGTELTVTIDDSPVKTAVEPSVTSGSDCEGKHQGKVPHSKKKLEYPKESEVISNTVEIEIPPVNEEDSLKDAKVTEPQPSVDTDNIIEIEESPLKVQGIGTSTPKKNHPAPQLTVSVSVKELQEPDTVDDELREFHPVYQSFIKLCFQLENSDDMKKIVEKKIKTYYRQVPKEYTESEEFTDMVAGKVLSMKAAPEKMYLYIKDIVDELNLQRKLAKSQVLSSINEKKATEGEKYYYGADEYDSKRQRQIRKLEKTLKKLHRAIQKLEDQEVDFDDEEDSVYLLTERYKERMVRVHAKFCQLTNTKMPSEPRVQIDARPGQSAGPAKRLEKWINKKVPIGTPLPFPDFHDVLRCVREANEEDKLGWNEADIMEEARDLFTRCGKKLQRRRQENEWRIAASRISAEVDPAEKNKELMKKLDDNKMIAAKKETEVFNKFADRQSQLKLEAEEIGDKEAEESPGDDDDEDEEARHTDESSLESKEKRKERLKRLLNEKNKKITDEPDSKKDTELDYEESKKSEKTDHKKPMEDERTKEEVKPVTEQNLNLEDTVKEKISKQENYCGNKAMEYESLDEKKDVSGNASGDSDAVEIVSNEKVDIHISNKTDTIKEQIENEIPTCTEKDEASDNPVEAHSISDESNKIESDVDELHLLQKLHSENEINTSTLDSADSETPIAISDTLGSSSDSKKWASSDVISIENSSYSESETGKEISELKDPNIKSNKIVEEIVDANTELECSNIGVEKKLPKTNNDEYNESIEDILLASTDDEVENDRTLKPDNDEECVNLKDDSLSIGDTVVEGVDKTQSSPEKPEDASSVDSLACVSLKDDSPDQPNKDTDSQDDDNTTGAISNGEEETKNAEIDAVDKNEDLNSMESENSVQSVPMIELKESSSEKEMEINDECSSTLPEEQVKENCTEIMDIVEVPVSSNEGEEKSNSAEEISDAYGESANSLDSDAKEISPDEIVDTDSKCTKSYSETDQVTENPKDSAIDKL